MFGLYREVGGHGHISVCRHSSKCFSSSFCIKEWVILLFPLCGRGRVDSSSVWVLFWPSSLSVKDCHRRSSFSFSTWNFQLVFMIMTESKRESPRLWPQIEQRTNTLKVYFIYKCVYVCVKYIGTIAYICMYMSEEVCGLMSIWWCPVFFYTRLMNVFTNDWIWGYCKINIWKKTSY